MASTAFEGFHESLILVEDCSQAAGWSFCDKLVESTPANENHRQAFEYVQKVAKVWETMFFTEEAVNEVKIGDIRYYTKDKPFIDEGLSLRYGNFKAAIIQVLDPLNELKDRWVRVGWVSVPLNIPNPRPFLT